MSATDSTPVRMRAGERREQLLEVTKQLVGEGGLHAVSIEAVARRAGITRPVVYDHFGDLTGLLEALLDRERLRAMGQLARFLPPDADDPDPASALLEALRGYLEVVRSDPVTWRLVLIPPEGAPRSLRARVTADRDAVVAQLADAVRRGLPGGSESPDPELTGRMLSAIADECARLVLTDPERFPTRRLLDHAAWMLAQLGPGGRAAPAPRRD